MRALAGVAGGAGRLDQREHGVAVAVDAQRAHGLRVAARRALVPELAARAAPEVQLAGLEGLRDRLLAGVRERQDLAGRPVLDDHGHEAAVVVADLRGIEHGRGIVAAPPGTASSGGASR
jgi:hypothetical protein